MLGYSMDKSFRQHGYIIQSDKVNAREMLEHLIEGCQCEGKLCTKCEQEKCYSAFYHISGKLRSICQKCSAEQGKTYRKAHPDYFRVKRREYVARNVDRVKSQKKADYQKRTEQIKQQTRANYQKSAEQHRAQKREYRKAHPELISERSRRYRESHPERLKVFYATNPGYVTVQSSKRRAYKKQVEGSYKLEEWIELKARYRYMCLCCGRSEPEIKLEADHVIPLSKGGFNNIDNIQPLCRSCNSHKHNKIIDYRKGKHHDR
jgi:5-methylcytosine-specific restriction endonuclease McrA